MATIPVNPERRDPGYLRKKADVGLSNVDNISATDFINVVADDVKIIGNRKINTGKFSFEGKESYVGILKTAELNTHTNFSTGLFKYGEPDKELAQFNVDLSFSTVDFYKTGSIGYTLQLPVEDSYLKDLEIVFTQIGAELYVTLYSKSFPKSTNQNFFNQLGTDITEWTEGTVLLDSSKDYSSIIKGGKELGRVKLNKPSSSTQTDSKDYLSVYNKNGEPVVIEPRVYTNAEMSNLDYPSVNGVPFIGKKGMNIGSSNGSNARNIIVQAKHSGPSKIDAGGHDWEVLNNLKISAYEFFRGPSYPPPIGGGSMPVSNGKFVATDSINIENNNSDISNKYGLCKLSQYSQLNNTFKDYDSAVELANEWLNNLGPDDTDVITVGMFRTFMSFFINQILGNISVNETTQVSYTSWVISTTQSIEETQPKKDGLLNITVVAKRNKITKYFVGGVEDESKRTTVEETATNDQIFVISEDGYEVTYGSNQWSLVILANTSSTDITRYVTVYVDKDKTSQVSKSLSVISKGNYITSSDYTISQFETPSPVGYQSSTYDIYFGVSVLNRWADGSQTSTYYRGNEVSITCDNDEVSLSYYEEGIYKITYPTNTETSTKTYILTCSYQGQSRTLEVTQSGYVEENIIVGVGYFLDVIPKSLSFSANPDSSQTLNIISYFGELWSNGELIKVNDQEYQVTYPDWISVEESTFGKETIIASKNTGSDRSGIITITQNVDEGKTVEIQVTQEAEEVTEVQRKVSLASISIDTSELPMEETTRTLKVMYKIVTTYSNGFRLVKYHNLGDINITIDSSNAEANPECIYNGDGSWDITFKKLSEGNTATFYISSEYEGVRSNTIVLTQGKTVTSTSYVFGLSGLSDDSLGDLLGSTFMRGNHITGIPASGGYVNVELISKVTDYYDDGTYYEHTDVVPFSSTNSSPYISDIDRIGNVLKLNFNESTEDTSRTTRIEIEQKYSGKILSLYLSQNPKTQEACIYIDGTKHVDGDQHKISLKNSSSSTTYNILPEYKVNGVSIETEYNEVIVSCESSWLQTSYSLGILTLQCSKNTSGSERTSIVTISYSKGVEVLMEVTQKAGDAYITIEGITGTSSYSVSKTKDNQTFSLSVESNYPYTISGTSSWVSILTGTSYSAGTSGIIFGLTENSSSLYRTSSFTITAGAVSRTVKITQIPRTYYIDVEGFENQDIHVCTSEWMNMLVIPLKFNGNFIIDYASDWLNVAISNKSDLTNPFHDDCDYFGNYTQSSGTQYLYVSQKDSTAVGGDVGVISLSYYDTVTTSLVATRKIYVSNLSNQELEDIYGAYGDNYQILPFGPRNLFIPGESTRVSMYAYTKNSLYKVKILDSSDSTLQKDVIQAAESNSPQGDKGLTSISVTIPENTTTKYRDISYTLVPSNLIDNNISNSFPTPIYHIYQYPKISLEFERTSFTVPYTGSDNLEIVASELNSCLGHFELKTNELPGWIIPVRPIYSINDSIAFKVEPNNNLESRSILLEFWCDSDISTVRSVTITQSGTSTPSTSGGNYFDKSLLEATTTESYFYVYNAKSITEKSFTLDTDGKVVDTGITVKSESTDISGKYKITYKKTTQNPCYDRDYIHGLVVIGTDSVNRLIIFKNSRTTLTSMSITPGPVSFSGSNGSSASTSVSIKSNIGLTSFIQSTNFDINKYPESCDFMTKDVFSKANNTLYVFSNLYNPEKRFLKKHVMDHIVFRNMDIIPELAKEIEVTLPSSLVLPERGIGVWDSYGNEIFSISTTKSESYNIYLDSNYKDTSGTVLNTRIYFRAYDGVTVSTISSGNGFDLVCNQSNIVKIVGSLGRQVFSVSAKSDNTGSSRLSLGTVKLSLSNGITKTFYIYQKANSINLVGETWNTNLERIYSGKIDNIEQCFDDDNAYLIYDTTKGEPTWFLTFQHTYQNWMITRTSGTGGYLKFNDSSYSETFGGGGNSGTSLITCNRGYAASIKIEAPDGGYTISNNSLDVQTKELYRISSTYSTGNITAEASKKGYIHVCTRPPIPNLSVYNSSNELVLGTDVSGVGKISASQRFNSFMKYYLVSFVFRLRSNYIDITKNYIGESVKVNGDYVDIETEYDIFKGLISGMSFEYKISGQQTWSSISLSTENFTTGVVDEYSYMNFGTRLRIHSHKSIDKAKLRIVLNDFVSDPQYYNPCESKELFIPLSLTLVGGVGTLG